MQKIAALLGSLALFLVLSSSAADADMLANDGPGTWRFEGLKNEQYSWGDVFKDGDYVGKWERDGNDVVVKDSDNKTWLHSKISWI